MPLISSTNPSHGGSVIDTIESTDPARLPDIVTHAHAAQSRWSELSVERRVELLNVVYHECETARESLAYSIAREMGMPIRQARDEISYGLTYWRWYLDHAVEYLSPEITRETETELHTVYYEPRGVILAIAPWNYPFSMMVWTCIQPLLAGNSVIFKTSRECILTGKLIADIFDKSDIPVGVWTEIYGSGELGTLMMGEAIDGVTFTGSTRVGKSLARLALEKEIGCVMELGGSAPGIVCPDADIDGVIETIYFLRYSNSGQMCDGLKRLIVHTSRYEEVVERLSRLLLSKKIGNASEESTDIGPVVSSDAMKHLQIQYEDALAKGATVTAELPLPEGLDGSYVTPRILTDITRDMLVWQEEVFGPILPIVTYETLDEAIKLANDTRYGLGAYVFTEDREQFRSIAKNIKSGMVQWNNLNYCIPESPFGGYRSSGIGREHGRWGFHEYCNIKVVSEAKTPLHHP